MAITGFFFFITIIFSAYSLHLIKIADDWIAGVEDDICAYLHAI